MVSLDVVEIRDKWTNKFENEHDIVTFMKIHFLVFNKQLLLLFFQLSLLNEGVHIG